MTRKPKKTATKAWTPTGNGIVELTEEQLTSVEGGSERSSAQGDGTDTTENVTINFAKVKYVYTPQHQTNDP